jgi:hypothetical protein
MPRKKNSPKPQKDPQIVKNAELISVEKSKDAREKSNLIAAWVVAIFTVLSVVFAVYQIYLGFQPKPIVDEITVSKVDLMRNYTTSIRSFSPPFFDGTTGIISVYWRIVISNIGEKDFSVTKYDMADKSDNSPSGTYYTGIDQGLFSCDGKYTYYALPFTVSNGGTTVVCLKMGLVMNKESFNLASSNFKDSTTVSFNEIETFLRSRETDIYGNKIQIISADSKNTYIYPALKDIREQLFVVNFYTSRGGVVHRIIGYYLCNGASELQLSTPCILSDDLQSFKTPVP